MVAVEGIHDPIELLTHLPRQFQGVPRRQALDTPLLQIHPQLGSAAALLAVPLVALCECALEGSLVPAVEGGGDVGDAHVDASHRRTACLHLMFNNTCRCSSILHLIPDTHVDQETLGTFPPPPHMPHGLSLMFEISHSAGDRLTDGYIPSTEDRWRFIASRRCREKCGALVSACAHCMRCDTACSKWRLWRSSVDPSICGSRRLRENRTKHSCRMWAQLEISRVA